VERNRHWQPPREDGDLNGLSMSEHYKFAVLDLLIRRVASTMWERKKKRQMMIECGKVEVPGQALFVRAQGLYPVGTEH
jgi:hypothetical protein